MRNGKPKVLHIITRLDPGGSATNTLISVDRLRDQGFDTELAYGATDDPRGTLRSYLAERNIHVTYLPDLVRHISPLKDVRAFLQIQKLCRRGNYDLVHTHSSKGGAIGRFASWSCGIPAVHTPHGHIYYGYFNRLVTSVFVRVERFLAHKTRKIVSLTERETKDSIWLRIGKSEQYCTIPSGVPLRHYRDVDKESGDAFRKRLEIPVHALLFVSTSRLVDIKGVDVLLKAFAACKPAEHDLYLALVGDGDERLALEALSKKLGLSDHVRFVGHMEDVRPALAAADVFVLASRNEGMGRSYIEAMAAGVPVVGTDVGGVGCFIRNGETGFLVPSENAEAFSAAMMTLAEDAPLRERMGRSGADEIYPDYDEDTMIQRLAALYREVLEGPVNT